MALLKCPECGRSVSEFAKNCPSCGCPIDDIAEEDQVEDMGWDNRKSSTDTQMYDPDELERSGKGAPPQRKPGQQKIVKSSGSSLPQGRSKNKMKKKKNKNMRIALFITLGVIIIAGGFIYYFAMVAPNDAKNDKETIETTIEETTYDNNQSYETQPPQTQAPTTQQQQTTQKPATQAPTTKKPTTQKPTTKPAPKPTTAPPADEGGADA